MFRMMITSTTRTSVSGLSVLSVPCRSYTTQRTMKLDGMILSHRHHHYVPNWGGMKDYTGRRRTWKGHHPRTSRRSTNTVLNTMPLPHDQEETTNPHHNHNQKDAILLCQELKRELLVLASVTNRGTLANAEEKDILSDLVTQLEALYPTIMMDHPSSFDSHFYENDKVHDVLILTNTQMFRSTPFFPLLSLVVRYNNGIQDFNSNLFFRMYQPMITLGKIGRISETFQYNPTQQQQEQISDGHGSNHRGVYTHEMEVDLSGLLAIGGWWWWISMSQNRPMVLLSTRGTFEYYSSYTTKSNKSESKNVVDPQHDDILQYDLTWIQIQPSTTKQGNVGFKPLQFKIPSPFLFSPTSISKGKGLHQTTRKDSDIQNTNGIITFKLTYVDEDLRIMRDVDDYFHVYSREEEK